MATTEGFGLQDIVRAVASELQLNSTDLVSVSKVTVVVTYSVDNHQEDEPDDEFLDKWYEEYVARMGDEEEVPF